MNARKYAAKRNYQEFQDADCGYDFHEWLGINKPRVDYDHHGNCRMYRIGNYRDVSIYGEWCYQESSESQLQSSITRQQRIQP
jgi:hypothetical protein